jgi:hypothetical protein
LIVWAISTFFIAPKPAGYDGVDVSAMMAKRQAERRQWCRDNLERTIKLMPPDLQKHASEIKC